jgi:putative flippase GtrA
MPKEKIKSFIDFFYPPFRKFMPLQTFRYAACGGFNVVFANILFAIIYHLIDNHQVIDVGFYVFKPYRFALFLSSAISFVVGFALNKYVVFTKSNIKGRIQLFRYFLAFLLSFFLNNILLQLLVENMHVYPVGAQRIATIVIVGVSYLVQNHFTFRTKVVQ